MRKTALLAISSVSVALFLFASARAQSGAGGQRAVRGPGPQARGQDQRPAYGGNRRQPGGGQTQRAMQPPSGFSLTPAQQKWVDDVLGYWESRSAKVDTFSCQFLRWEYNPAFVRDPNTPWTEASGVIKYAQPDKAMYRVDEVKYYQAPQRQGERPRYVAREGEHGEHWVCDGQSTFEFDHRGKQLIERPLPAHMQGRAIADGPLPFLFGAEAAKLKQRYWFRPLLPPKVKDPRTGKTKFVDNEYWLAAKPKTRQDAANFELVEIIIDKQDFLPKAMQIHLPGGRERKVFQFSEREVNPPFRLLQRDFSKPRLPVGWKKVVERIDAPARRTALTPTSGRRHASQIPVAQQRR